MTLFLFLTVVQAIIAALLVTVILMQKSEGGGLGVGSSPSGFMSARGAADFMTRATSVLATLFVGLSVVLATLAVNTTATHKIDTSLNLVAAPVDPLAGAQNNAPGAPASAAPVEAPVAPALASPAATPSAVPTKPAARAVTPKAPAVKASVTPAAVPSATPSAPLVTPSAPASSAAQ